MVQLSKSPSICDNCFFFNRHPVDPSNLDPDARQGSCYRYPPVPHPVGQDPYGNIITANIRPVMSIKTKACGEYKPRISLDLSSDSPAE